MAFAEVLLVTLKTSHCRSDVNQLSRFPDPIFVIIEYISGGTLQDFLRKSRSEHNYKNLHGESQTLSARDLTSYAYQGPVL